MATTTRRWVNVTGLCIGSIAFHDLISASIDVNAQTLGSNSEDDVFANHFVTAIKAGGTVSFRTYDVYAAMQAAATIGTMQSVSWKLLPGMGVKTSEGAATYTFSSSTGDDLGIMVTGVTIPGEHDSESQCEVSGVFRSDGKSKPWSTA